VHVQQELCKSWNFFLQKKFSKLENFFAKKPNILVYHGAKEKNQTYQFINMSTAGSTADEGFTGPGVLTSVRKPSSIIRVLHEFVSTYIYFLIIYVVGGSLITPAVGTVEQRFAAGAILAAVVGLAHGFALYFVRGTFYWAAHTDPIISLGWYFSRMLGGACIRPMINGWELLGFIIAQLGAAFAAAATAYWFLPVNNTANTAEELRSRFAYVANPDTYYDNRQGLLFAIETFISFIFYFVVFTVQGNFNYPDRTKADTTGVAKTLNIRYFNAPLLIAFARGALSFAFVQLSGANINFFYLFAGSVLTWTSALGLGPNGIAGAGFLYLGSSVLGGLVAFFLYILVSRDMKVR
jgi:hypothetical protein